MREYLWQTGTIVFTKEPVLKNSHHENNFRLKETRDMTISVMHNPKLNAAPEVGWEPSSFKGHY
jgi:hypothetical protein